MNTFPTLKTGAVFQHPSARATSFSTDVVQFVDGSEQRFAEFSTPLHQWTVNYNALDEGELQALRNFIRQVEGSVEPFSFTDPWTGTTFPTCTLVGERFSDSLQAPSSSKSQLVISEIHL